VFGTGKTKTRTRGHINTMLTINC